METAVTESELKNSDCVRVATTNVLMGTCGLQAEVTSPAELPDQSVLAVISLMGDVEWTLFINLTATTAAEIASKFAGFPIQADSGDLADAVGELANILAGEVKAQLDQRGVKANLSLPSVLRGNHVQVLSLNGVPNAWNYFQTAMGTVCTGVVQGKKLTT